MLGMKNFMSRLRSPRTRDGKAKSGFPPSDRSVILTEPSPGHLPCSLRFPTGRGGGHTGSRCPGQQPKIPGFTQELLKVVCMAPEEIEFWALEAEVGHLGQIKRAVNSSSNSPAYLLVASGEASASYDLHVLIKNAKVDQSLCSPPLRNDNSSVTKAMVLVIPNKRQGS